MAQPSNPGFRFGNFSINPAERRLLRRGESVPLTPKVFDTLLLLVKNAGHLVEKETFLKQLWPDAFVEEASLAQNISVLRKVLGDDGNGNKFIETIPKRGYRFVAEVKDLTDEITDTRNGGGTDQRGGPAADHTAVPQPVTTAEVHESKRKSVNAALSIALVVAALAIAAGTGYILWRRSHGPTQSAHRVMMVVLPFQNLSGDSTQDYVSDGLTEEMITQFGRMDPQQLGVIARTSAMAYKETRKTTAEIGRELGVDYILEGSVRRDDSRVRVSAQLIQVKDQTHLWARSYDRDMRDLLSLQGEVAQAIAEEIQIKLSKRPGALPTMNRPVDVEAYEIYLLGLYYWNRRSQADLQRGIAYFQQAIDRDPNNALAYAGLANSYFVRAISGAVPTEDAMPKAKAAALKALELDDSLAEAHTSLAHISANYEWNWVKAESEYKKAIELNPSYSTGHHYYAMFLMAMGRHTEALEEMKRAQKLDPLSPAIVTFIGKAHYYAGNNEEAIRQYRKVLDSDPSFPIARSFLIDSLELAGRFEDAVAELKIEAAQLGGSSEQAEARVRAYREAGPAGYWRESLRQRQAGGDLGPGSDLDTASIYARLGDKAEAFSLLDRAYAQRNMWLMNLKVDPRFDNLRSDSRFQSLLDRVGLR
jgi:TolB-like protein/DNA-binding winged helix-turn-helix (wHTH) protein/Tfp pilus assembly protein PilF